MSEKLIIFLTVLVMLIYFLLAQPVLMDDGFQYQGFTESLARGELDFKSFYGFQGLSFFAVPVFLLTDSPVSIVITSAIFSILSIFLAYAVGKSYYSSPRAGIYFLILFLFAPYSYTTMFRGFQEAALSFFILLIIYGAINKKIWTPFAWAVGSIVKPFALVLFPLFVKDFLKPRKFIWLIAALALGSAYLGASYYQTGHFINNAAIGSYQGFFDTGNPPPLMESFTFGIKGFLRVGANLLLFFRKIMISPFVVILGALAVWVNKNFKMRKEIILAVALNFLLVGSLTFSFPKYLLPMTTLFALASIDYLLKYKWLWAIVFVDSLFVFFPIWNYFGRDFWLSPYIYLIPFYWGVILFVYERLFQKHYSYSDS